jgi:hypothetical protein
MPTLKLTLPKPHVNQQRILDGARRYNVIACGRRFGKSHLLINRQASTILQGRNYGYFAPNYKLLGDYWRDTIKLLRPIIANSNKTDHRIEFVTGGSTEMWTLEDEDAGRSRKYHRVGIDEAGLVANLGEIWQTAIRATLIDFKGDADFAGTPKGRNFFYEVYQRGLDALRPDWACWQMPTSANPFISPDEVQAMRDEVSERKAAQEIDAAFLDDAGGVFRNVRAAATATIQDRPIPGHQYIIGADWGRSGDYTVFALLDATSMQLVALDRSNKVEYELQRGRLNALAERFQPAAIIAEENSMGVPIVERLRRDGLPVRPFTTTNASKAEIIDGLALAFERGTIAILDNPILIAELEAFEMTRTPSGLVRYAAPEGMHDDTVMGLALAWHGAQRPKMQSASFDFYARAPQAITALPQARSDEEIEQLLNGSIVGMWP